MIRRIAMDRLGLLCRNIYENNKMTQRELAAAMNLSLGNLQPSREGRSDRELFTFDPADGSYSPVKGRRGAFKELPDGQRRDPCGGIRIKICSADV